MTRLATVCKKVWSCEVSNTLPYEIAHAFVERLDRFQHPGDWSSSSNITSIGILQHHPPEHATNFLAAADTDIFSFSHLMNNIFSKSFSGKARPHRPHAGGNELPQPIHQVLVFHRKNSGIVVRQIGLGDRHPHSEFPAVRRKLAADNIEKTGQGQVIRC